MLVPASIANLNQYTSDPFERVLRQVQAAQIEGLRYFELDLLEVSDEERMDLMTALEDLGYTADYYLEDSRLLVNYDI